MFRLPAASGLNVDFSYSFAPPHRMTVCLPDSGDKTLLDLEPGKLTLSWTYEKLADWPFHIYKPPRIDWKIAITPRLEGHPFATSAWRRLEGSLPVLENLYEDSQGWVRLEVAGGEQAALVKITLANTGEQAYTFSLDCQVISEWDLHNHAWIDSLHNPDTLVAMFYDRPDRVLAFGSGADEYPFGKKSMTLAWRLGPGEVRTGWIVRPYQAYESDLPKLRADDWEGELEKAVQTWRDLFGRAVKLEIPDPAVKDAYYACLADLFVMREPLGRGYVGAVPGTELYRSANPFEGTLASLALDQAGFHTEAADGLRIYLETQEPGGEWADDKGWTHHMWGASGFKAWTAMEHFRLTQDRSFLEWIYPRLTASTRWQETQRNRSRILIEGERPVTYGLMPRGMGDCGLMDDDDLAGVFYPHNILSVYADRLAVEAAEILGREEDLPELRQIYENGCSDLLASLEQGAIHQDGYRWIPGTPNKTSGSRWGVLYSCSPCGILPPEHDLIEGTLRYIEARKSPGGHPLHTGWMPDGCWIAISLDNLAEVHLARENSDAAVEYLYATLNHGTPLYSWCEERGIEPGTTNTSGDRQHLFTPVGVARFIRDALVLEKGGGLHLALGTARSWLASGKRVGIWDASTHFGRVSYQMCCDLAAGEISGTVCLPEKSHLPWAVLHIRLPGALYVRDVQGARIMENGEGISWNAPRGTISFTCQVDRRS
jgi:hypothetical protein